jgi:hypothetical protein
MAGSGDLAAINHQVSELVIIYHLLDEQTAVLTNKPQTSGEPVSCYGHRLHLLNYIRFSFVALHK